MQHLNTEIQTAHSVIYYLYLYIVIPNTWFLSNTTFQNYDDIIERSCQAWNEILSENGFIKIKRMYVQSELKLQIAKDALAKNL
jgi:hypothetical protein